MGSFRTVGLRSICDGEQFTRCIGTIVPNTHVFRVMVNPEASGFVAESLEILLAAAGDHPEIRLLLCTSGDPQNTGGVGASLEQGGMSLAEGIEKLRALSERNHLRLASHTPDMSPDASMSIICSDCDGNLVEFRPLATSLAQGPDITVRWSWGDPTRVVAKAAARFDDIWENQSKALSPDDAFVRSVFASCQNTPGLFPHQRTALQQWEANHFQGIFRMCTGAGKTIASLAGIRRLQHALKAKGEELKSVVVACPTQVLVEQWHAEIRAFGFDPASILLVYESRSLYMSRLGICLDATRHEGLRIIVTTYASLFDDVCQHQIQMASQNGASSLLIADEMHNCASPRIRRMLTECDHFFRYRLGLSATPEIEGDDDATKVLFKYFGGIVAKYELTQAIHDGVLCQYKYYPRPAFLSPELSAQYMGLLQGIDAAPDDQPVSLDLYRQRRELLRRSEVYFSALDDVLGELTVAGAVQHLLVYCPPGRSKPGDDDRLIYRVKSIAQEHDLLVTSITSETPMRERPEILRGFSEKEFQVLLGIACLDEGLNIPAIRTAIMLYSIDRSRQFVQRRGRILRRAVGKEYAVIHDVILLPHSADMPTPLARRLLEKELRRYSEFAETAMNQKEAQDILDRALNMATSEGGLYV